MRDPNAMPLVLIESMLTRVLRTPAIFDEFASIIRPEHFNYDEELPYRLLWAAVLNCRDSLGQRTHEDPATHAQRCYQTLRDAVHIEAHRTNAPPTTVAAITTEGTYVPGLLWWSFYGVSPAMLDIAQSQALTRAFVEERYVRAPLVAAVTQGMIHTKLPEVIADITQRQQRLLAVGVSPIISALPDILSTKPRRMISTGLEYFDQFMEGGHAPGEVNALLGPSGVGKSQLATGLGWGSITVWNRLVQEGKATTVPTSYIATIEMSGSEFQRRCWAHAAQIHISQVSNISDNASFGTLSSRAMNNFKPYELERHHRLYGDGASLTEMTGELDRLNAARPFLRDRLKILDLSGSGPSPGDGGVDEIKAAILADQRATGNPGVGVVIIDYVLLAVKRYIAARNMNESSALRHETLNYVDRAKQQLAIGLDCPVWLLQQLNGAGNSGPPTKPTTHLQASEASSFCYPLAFAGCLSPKDAKTNTCLLNFSKRRHAGEYVEPIILHIVGEYATVENGTGKFICDPIAQRIVPSAEAQFGTVQDVCTPHETANYKVIAGC